MFNEFNRLNFEKIYSEQLFSEEICRVRIHAMLRREGEIVYNEASGTKKLHKISRDRDAYCRASPSPVDV